MDAITLARAMKIDQKAAGEWVDAFNKVMETYLITTPARQAAFLGQIGHETAGLTRLEEDLNYSATRLMQVWPRRFSMVNTAAKFAHNPEALANHVYANRLGNGDEASGDGWRFRGRGCAMLTGRANYAAFSDATTDLAGLPDRFVSFPEHVAEDKLAAAASAGWFWYSRSLNDYADRGDYEGISRRWNGGEIGMDDRIARTERALEALA